MISVNEDNNTNTRKVDKHSVNSWCFSIQSKYDLELEQETFMYIKTDESETEDTVISRFLESLKRQVRYINFKLQNLRKNHQFYILPEYEANREAFEAAEKCSICNLSFDNDVHSKVFHQSNYFQIIYLTFLVSLNLD